MKDCRLCTIIRYFIASIFLLVIVSLTMSENLHYLAFVTPWNAVYLIITLGIILFLWKLYVYIKTKN